MINQKQLYKGIGWPQSQIHYWAQVSGATLWLHVWISMNLPLMLCNVIPYKVKTFLAPDRRHHNIQQTVSCRKPRPSTIFTASIHGWEFVQYCC